MLNSLNKIQLVFFELNFNYKLINIKTHLLEELTFFIKVNIDGDFNISKFYLSFSF
jgi:hypothetical protein